MEVFMKRLLYLCVILSLCLCWGCGDPPNSVMELVLPDNNDTAEPPGSSELRPMPGDSPIGETAMHTAVTSIPPHLQELWWGSWDDTLETLQGVDFAKVKHPVTLFRGFGGICLRAEQEHYYTKYMDADGIAIIGSQIVDDAMLLAARQWILIMTEAYPGIRQALAPETGFRMILVHNGFENPYSLPEARHLSHNFNLGIAWCVEGYCVARADTVGGENGIYYGVVGGDFLHEFAHAIQDAFLKKPGLFPHFAERLQAAYDEGLQSIAYQNSPDNYWWVDVGEFWAEASRMWLEDMGHFGAEPVPVFNEPDFDALVPTPTEMWEEKLATWREAFPKITALLEDVYPIRPLGQMLVAFPIPLGKYQ